MNDLNIGLCITCKHYHPIESGYEFEGIADTAYIKLHCSVFGKSIRDDYLMAGVPEELEPYEKKSCEFWEFWDQ